jgi:hypothetical protein
MDNVIRGLRPAARRAGIAVRTLRELIEAGAVRAQKDADGRWTFDARDLERLSARSETNEVVFPAPTVAAAVAYAAPEQAELDEVAPAPQETPQISDWLLAACEPEVDEVEAEHAPTRTQAVLGPPLGSTAMPTWLTTFPSSPAPAHIAEVEAARREVEAARARVDAAADECQRWAAAWRRERIAAIAGAIAVEIVMAGHHVPQVVIAVRDRVAHALNALTNVQLADEAYVYGLARAVASQTIAWHAHAAQEAARHRDPVDDLARARWRRRSRR